MHCKKYSHRFALQIIDSDEFLGREFEDIYDAIDSITDQEVIEEFNNIKNNERPNIKSVSEALNRIIKRNLIARGWNAESQIFSDPQYSNGGIWRLDFAKNDFAVEVAFNHRSDICWNLVKPVLSSELNHVRKAIQTEIGVIITATESLKETGGYDSACGTYEQYIDYLNPMSQILTCPLVIIGLDSFDTFYIEHYHPNENRSQTWGRVVQK